MYAVVLSHSLEGADNHPVVVPAQATATDCLSLNSSSMVFTDATADWQRSFFMNLISGGFEGSFWSHVMLPPDADKLIFEANVLSHVCTSSLKIRM